VLKRLLRRASDTVSILVEDGLAAEPVGPPVPAEGVTAAEVARTLRMVGVAQLEAGEATSDVQDVLHRLAVVNGHPDARLVVLPTVVFVQLSGETAATEIGRVGRDPLRLDQAGALERLVEDAGEGDLRPAEMRDRLEEIRRTPPPHGPALVVLGHTVMTLGFGLLVNPATAALPAYLLLGAVVGLMVVAGRRLPVFATVLPVVAAFTVSVLVAAVLTDVVGPDPFLLLAPPLVSFLPGLTMTIAAIELTNDEVVAGASRIVYGIAQLTLLGFGVYAAFTLVGEITPTAPLDRLGPWAPWLGVLVTAAGYALFASVPRGAFTWLVAALYVTVAAQNLGNVLLGPELSGFVGALAVVPFAALVTRRRSAPPAVVLIIPSFWLLVPGALGFTGVAQVANDLYGGPETLFDTALALLSVALGILVGTGITRHLITVRDTWRQTSRRPGA
jgi:uncharacterized membrane protein YjjP (DUF1212 family)